MTHSATAGTHFKIFALLFNIVYTKNLTQYSYIKKLNEASMIQQTSKPLTQTNNWNITKILKLLPTEKLGSGFTFSVVDAR